MKRYRSLFGGHCRKFVPSADGTKAVCVPRQGQSTVELALLLPTLMLMLGMIIYVYKIYHASSEKTVFTYSDRVTKFNHGNGLIFDPETGQYVNASQYSEHIPPDAVISPSNIANAVLPGLLANLGLNEIFSRLKIFDTRTYGGAFAQGFTYSMASSSVNHLVQDGNLQGVGTKDFESAAWAGAASSFSSGAATRDFQGSKTGTVTGAQEFFGSGAQAGLIGFSKSEGDWKAGATSAVGGMINSDTTKGWTNSGNDLSQIMKGAGLGAVQSSASGIINDNFNVKTVLIGSASGAVQTNAFAKTLPLTGKSDPKNSAMYGAFNGAFSSVVSGGDTKTTLISAATGALGSKQTANVFGGSKSLGYQATTIAGTAAGQAAKGDSLKAVGVGAIAGVASSAVGWAGNQISPSLAQKLGSANNSNDVLEIIKNEKTPIAVAGDNFSTDNILDEFTNSIFESESLKSLKSKEEEEKKKEQEERDHTA